MDVHNHGIDPACAERLVGSCMVAFDPFDESVAERLRDFLDTKCDWFGMHEDNTIEHLAEALRSLVEPPKPPRPDEPTGLGAVVEAVCDCQNVAVRFVRDPDARDFNLHLESKAATGAEVPWVSRCGHHAYDVLTNITVLSEGVE